MKYVIIVLFITSAVSCNQSFAEQKYKVGIFGGFSYLDFAGGLPERFEGEDDTRWGAYTGLTGGIKVSEGAIDTGLELTPMYLLSGVDGGSQIHTMMVPFFGTISAGSNNKLVAGAGTGPLLTDMYRSNDFGWGIFGKLSALLSTSEDYGGNIGPQIQIFTDVTTTGQNIWGLLFGLNYETFLTGR